MLFEYAATLGVVDVAYTGARGARADYRGLRGADGYDSLSRYDGLAAVRVNELGAAILHDPGALPALGLPVPRRILRKDARESRGRRRMSRPSSTPSRDCQMIGIRSARTW